MSTITPGRIAVLVVLAAGAAGAWWFVKRPAAEAEFRLYGNVDFRQVSLPFNGNDRIKEILVEEGASVRQGQVLARLDSDRLKAQVDQAQAAVAAQRSVVERLRNGSRAEEVAQARANLASAKAEATNARGQYQRRRVLADRAAGSQQDLDSAEAAAAVADAKVEVSQRALELTIAGPRREDIAQAEAQLNGNIAQLALIQRQFADTELASPIDGIVRSRLMEPGEMASPTRPVFSLAQIRPKWVRTYVPETRLGQVRSGMRVHVSSDSFPGQRFEGWIGFISPVAEFTPKTVQTEDLRTSLVYEVRAFVEDPDDQLRLGMPATVRLTANGGTASNEAAQRPAVPARQP
ncbi:efflux RND transporter periplasmic adaptor subunit [Phreatobacter stygius]|uniref:HlyD family efflux transporter periplasmic adaptor subunit n=1 Tax=Phreatobacter stygius TaxID=1940610 RepID=A0A4D7BDH9_9HYPH|nr:efflux RND transporter periplasmic adaptor subunit [Phreatobacter stygius]QCI67416.1 HlyD family efflux transporter periplasmic adaptor subunit [Phreatobacter stygius]